MKFGAEYSPSMESADMVKPAVESMVKCLADAIEVRRELPEFREEPSEISFREALSFQWGRLKEHISFRRFLGN